MSMTSTATESTALRPHTKKFLGMQKVEHGKPVATIIDAMSEGWRKISVEDREKLIRAAARRRKDWDRMHSKSMRKS